VYYPADAVKLLDLVLLKQAAIQVRNLAEQLVGGGGTIGFLPSEALEEKRTEKFAVVSIGFSMAALRELVAQIILIVIQKALLLNEVEEHEPVNHDRGVPALHLLIRDALEVAGCESIASASWP
jgi:hypothetical protein